MMLSEHFSLREMTKSIAGERLGIVNEPLPWNIDAMKLVCEKVLEPVRAHFEKPVTVLSGYRGTRLNTAIGGARNSQHMLGQAVDFEVNGVANADVAIWVRDNIDFDQLILEFYSPGDPQSGWVHCSYVGEHNRRTVLTARKGKVSRVTYTPGLLV